MAKPLHEYLRDLAAQIEKDEQADRDAEAKKKLAELEGAALSADDRELLDWARKFRAELEKDDGGNPPAAPGRVPSDPEQKPKEDDPKPPAARKTRPGRKSGMAYQWTVDDTGKVEKLDLARVYSGPDEPDEVEIVSEPAAA